MFCFKRYTPGFVERNPSPDDEANYESLDVLFNTEYFTRLAAIPGFIRFERGSGNTLMAIYDDGFYVIGFADPPSALDYLPKWTSPDHPQPVSPETRTYKWGEQ